MLCFYSVHAKSLLRPPTHKLRFKTDMYVSKAFWLPVRVAFIQKTQDTVEVDFKGFLVQIIIINPKDYC